MQQSWTGDTIGRPIRSKLFVSFTLIGQNLNITSMGGRKGLLAKVVTSIDARIAGVVALLALLLRPPAPPPPLLLLLVVLLSSLGQLLAPSLPWLLRRGAVRDDCGRHLSYSRGCGRRRWSSRFVWQSRRPLRWQRRGCREPACRRVQIRRTDVQPLLRPPSQIGLLWCLSWGKGGGGGGGRYERRGGRTPASRGKGSVARTGVRRRGP